jgi:hypothetical protein
VLAADVNGDGWTDLYVANDGDPNQLWINKGGTGKFEDEALLTGVAVDRLGRAQGSMGVDLADVDGDGDEDLFVTNLDNEGNTLYRNQGRGVFEDRTSEVGVFRLGFTGFGTRFVDYDNDGWLDLVVVNGAVRQLASQIRTGDPYPLRQRSMLFHNDQGRRFADVTEAAGDAFAPLQVARGLLAGDLDNDGDVDLVIASNNGRARVLRNDVGSRQHWLGIRAVDGRYRRDAIQARITVVRPVATCCDESIATAATPARAIHVSCSGLATTPPRRPCGLIGPAAGSRNSRTSRPTATGFSSAASRRAQPGRLKRPACEPMNGRTRCGPPAGGAARIIVSLGNRVCVWRVCRAVCRRFGRCDRTGATWSRCGTAAATCGARTRGQEHLQQSRETFTRVVSRGGSGSAIGPRMAHWRASFMPTSSSTRRNPRTAMRSVLLRAMRPGVICSDTCISRPAAARRGRAVRGGVSSAARLADNGRTPRAGLPSTQSVERRARAVSIRGRDISGGCAERARRDRAA